MFHSYNHKKQMHNDKNRCAFFKIMEDLIIIGSILNVGVRKEPTK